MHNFITWYDILTVFIWTIIFSTVIAIILLVISHFTEKLRIKKSELPSEKPQPKERFKIVERSNKDDYKFKDPRPEPPPTPPPLPKNVIAGKYIEPQECKCWDLAGTFKLLADPCQNRMADGKCTSFVCTKIVRFK